MVSNRNDRSAATVWWTNPTTALCALSLLTAIIAVKLHDEDFITLWRVHKLVAGRHIAILCLIVVMPFVVGGLIEKLGRQRLRPTDRPARDDPQLLFHLYRVSLALSALGYVAWACSGFVRGARPWDLFALVAGTKSYGTLRSQLRPISGVTTFSQLLILGTVVRVVLKHRYHAHLDRLPFYLLVGCVILRAALYSERLALIEVLLPWLLIRMKFIKHRPSIWVMPIVLLIAIVAYFGITERSRSWQSFYKTQGGTTFQTFVIGRMAGYYITAVNNGAVYYDSRKHPALPYYSFEGLWNLPLVKNAKVHERLTGSTPTVEYRNIIDQQANLEFNNPSGGLLLASDLPPVWCALLCLSAGAYLSTLRRRYISGPGGPEIWYPILFVGILEFPLLLYWNGPRIIPVAAVYWIVVTRFRRRVRRTESNYRLPPRLALYEAAISG